MKVNMKIAIINGPNLNLLGKREPEVYGHTSFEEYLVQLRREFPIVNIEYFQSNVEGELVTAIQKYGYDSNYKGIILNAAAYSHTSIAIADAIAAIPLPTVVVHISNIFSREEERKTDLILQYAKGSICGLGLHGYKLALNYLISNISNK